MKEQLAQEFFNAVSAGDVAKVRSLLTEEPSLVFATDPRRKIPNKIMALHIASSNCNVELVRVLTQHGARADATGPGEFTPLHNLISRDHGPQVDKLEILELLIAAGADVNARNEQGLTPLYSAVFRGYGRGDPTDVVAALIGHGADVNAPPPEYGISGPMLYQAVRIGKDGYRTDADRGRCGRECTHGALVREGRDRSACCRRTWA
jgi:ankyrin repeat protein